MGDHKDDEKEIDPNVPIASLTLGAERDFIFKHQDRKKQTLNYQICLYCNNCLKEGQSEHV